jgi:putative DNA primase/helicase
MKEFMTKKINPVATDSGTTPLIPDVKQMQAFIRLLHTVPAWYQTYSKGPKKASGGESFASPINITLRDRLIGANKRGMNVSVAVNTIVGDQRKSENVSHINAVFIDHDGAGITRNQLLELTLAPNMVVQTSPRHYHAYWLVSDCAVHQFRAVQRALAKRFGTDTNVCDAARAMRLPGSINWKYEPPCLAQTIHELDRKPIKLAQLIKELDLVVEVDDADDTKQSSSTTDVQAIVTPLNANKLARIRTALAKINADDRTVWLRVGMAIHSVIPTEQGYALWTTWSESSGKYEAADQRRTWDGFKSGSGKGIGIRTLFWMADQNQCGNALDQMELAQMFANNYVSKLRYDPDTGHWYNFDGVVWLVKKQAPVKYAKALLQDLSAGQGKKGGDIQSFRNIASINSLIKMAESEQVLSVGEANFDRDVDLFAVKNGVIDLKTGELRAARAQDFLRRCANVEYIKDATCPLWLKFIDQVTCGDAELAKFLQRCIGYTLFGHTKSQVFFVLEGSGSNGKGSLLRTLAAMLGAYAAELSPNLITSAYSNNANASSPALASLKGIRLGSVPELPSKRGFDTAFVKQFAGGDSITARTNYGDPFTFKPEGKLWISTNDMPEIAASDEAMWRRIVPIPFRGKFSDKKRDDDLEIKLSQELSGILNWAVAGATDYAAKGKLGTCEAVEQHKKQLRRESDTFGGWKIEHLIEEVNTKLQASKAYASYSTYARRMGKAPISTAQFKVRMESQGFAHKATKKYHCYLGIGLRPAAV